jgi:hypothetical protein
MGDLTLQDWTEWYENMNKVCMKGKLFSGTYVGLDRVIMRMNKLCTKASLSRTCVLFFGGQKFLFGIGLDWKTITTSDRIKSCEGLVDKNLALFFMCRPCWAIKDCLFEMQLDVITSNIVVTDVFTDLISDLFIRFKMDEWFIVLHRMSIVHHLAFLHVSFCNSIWCFIVCCCASFGVSLCTSLQ